MLDFVGVTDFHGDDDEQIAGEVMEGRTPYKVPETSGILLTLDVDDHIDPATHEWLTLDRAAMRTQAGRLAPANWGTNLITN